MQRLCMDAPDMDVAVQRRAGCTKRALPDISQDDLKMPAINLILRTRVWGAEE
jgi:hypothetical protein